MKKIISFLIFTLFNSSVYSQCVGCDNILNTIELSIKKDSLIEQDIGYIPISDTLKIFKSNNFYKAKNYNIEIYKKSHSNREKTIFSNKWEHNLKNNKIQINYSSAFIYGNECSEYLIKENDIIISIQKENKFMKIILKLYNGNIGLKKNKINLVISFCEGTFEITDSMNPRLIAIKEEEE